MSLVSSYWSSFVSWNCTTPQTQQRVRLGRGTREISYLINQDVLKLVGNVAVLGQELDAAHKQVIKVKKVETFQLALIVEVAVDHGLFLQ